MGSGRERPPVPGLKSKLRRASLLGGRDSLRTVAQGGFVVVTLPGPAPDPVASVIKLEFDAAAVVDQPLP
jgi:alpha-L-fucosidase